VEKLARETPRGIFAHDQRIHRSLLYQSILEEEVKLLVFPCSSKRRKGSFSIVVHKGMKKRRLAGFHHSIIISNSSLPTRGRHGVPKLQHRSKDQKAFRMPR